MIKIDAHHHLWQFNPIRDTWIDDTMKILRRDYLPEHLAPLLSENSIDGTVAIQAAQSESETEFLLDLASKYEFIKGVSGWVDLSAENVAERLAFFSQNELFKGVRHIVQDEPDDFLLRPDFQKGVGELSRFGLTYDILIYQHQLPAAIQLVRQFPDQKFVLNHVGKPKTMEEIDREWKCNIHELAKSRNVLCKISGSVWSKRDYIQVLDEVLSAFGTERVMYGSDWPVCLLTTNYKESVSNAEKYIATLSKDEQAGIMGGNATEFYDLKHH